jgi:AbrB family looped-hinge helix DNA binding protein
MHMAVAKVGSRGRIALPREVREHLGLGEGDTVLFLLDGDQVRLARSPEDFGQYVGLLGSGPAGWEGPEGDTEEI